MTEAEPRLGIVCALAAEARWLGVARPQPGALHWLDQNVVLSLCGIGQRRAARAAEQLRQQPVDALLVWGCAGALEPALRPGALLLPQAVVGGRRRMPLDSRWRARLCHALGPRQRLCDGPILSVSEALYSPRQKAQAYRRSGAVAVDMESLAVAEVAAAAGLPLMVLRAVVDPADQALPRLLQGAVDPFGVPRSGTLCRALWRRPCTLWSLLRLWVQQRQARRALRTVIGLLGPQLRVTEVARGEA